MSELTGNGKDFWNLKDQSPIPWVMPPPTKLHILIVSKEFCQLQTKYPYIWAFGGHSHSNHYEQQQTLEVPSTDYSSRGMQIKAPLIWLMVDNRKCAGKFLRKNYFQSECLYLWKYHSSMKVKYFSTCQTFTHLPQLSTRVDRCRFRLPNFPCVSGFKPFTQSTASMASVHPHAHPMPAFPMICKQLLSKGCVCDISGMGFGKEVT